MAENARSTLAALIHHLMDKDPIVYSGVRYRMLQSTVTVNLFDIDVIQQAIVGFLQEY